MCMHTSIIHAYTKQTERNKMRTQVSQATFSPFNAKWSVSLDVYRGVPSDEYLVSTVESASVFDSEDLALAGGGRALDVLAATGKYPNMCKAF